MIWKAIGYHGDTVGTESSKEALFTFLAISRKRWLFIVAYDSNGTMFEFLME